MARLESELTVDFSDGMYDSVAPTRYPRASAAQIINGRLEPDGTVSRRSGTIRTHPTLLAAGTGFGAIAFTTAAGTDQLIAIFGTTAFRSEDDGATWIDITGGVGLLGNYYSFATMRVGATNYLFMANGHTTIKRWDGTTLDTLPNAPSGVKFIAVFNSRLYAAGHSGVQVVASKIADPTIFATPDGLLVQILTHDGDPPTGMFQIGPHLLIYDKDATSYIDGFGEQTIIVASGATGFSRSVGCIAFRTIVGVGENGACWLSERGVEFYSPGAGIQLISRSTRKFFNSIDWVDVFSNPGRPSATYDELNQDYLLALSTNGVRNNRIHVSNLRQNVQFQRPGQRSAAAIDVLQSSAGGDILFAGGVDDYLTVAPGGSEAKSDINGYMSLDTASTGGDPTSEDADGYLGTVTDDTLPATLFTAHSLGRQTVYSQGYDGFVRRHFGVGKDDTLSDSTGGIAVSLKMISKPFLQKYPRNRKRGRVIHVASINDDPATLTVLMRGKDTTSPERTISIPATPDDAQHGRARTGLVATAPQVELRTSDDVRISLVGISGEVLREPI